MFAHAINLLARSFAAIPTSLGSNWLGLLFPVLLIIAGEVIGGFFFGWHVMKENWKKATGIGFAAMGVSYTLLFCWCIAKTTFQDHTNLNSRIAYLHDQVAQAKEHQDEAIQNVKDDLGSKINTLQNACSKLEGANGALNKQTADQQNTINNCQTNALKLLAPEPPKVIPINLDVPSEEFGLHEVRWLVLSNKTYDPTNVLVSCNLPIISGTGSIAGTGGLVIGSTGKIDDKSYEVRLSQTWGPESPFLFLMQYRGGSILSCSFNPR